MVTSVRVCDPKCLMPVPTPVSAYSNLCCPHSDGHVSVSRQRIVVHQSSWRQYPEKTGQTCFEQNPDRQASETADSLISKHPDRVSTADRIETKQIRRQTPDSIFSKVRTESGQLRKSRQTESGWRDIEQKVRTSGNKDLLCDMVHIIWYRDLFYS